MPESTTLSASQLRALRAAKARKLVRFRFSIDGTWFIEGGGPKPRPGTVRALFGKELLSSYPDGERSYAVPTDAGREALKAAEEADR